MKQTKTKIWMIACVATWAAGICSLAQAADPWQHLTTDQGLPGNEVQFVKADSAGTLWVGTLEGLAKFKAGKFEATPVKAEAWDVLRIDDTSYWVGTGQGVLRVTSSKTTSYLSGSTVAPIATLGKTLLALSKDRRTEESTLVESGGGEWTPVTALKGKRANDMVQLANGQVWVTIEGDGVEVFDPAKGTTNPDHYLEARNVTSITQDSSGKVWCGLWQHGVSVYDGKTWTEHLADQSIYTLAIRQDKQGQIWVSTDKAGIWRYDGKSWTNDLKDEGPITLMEPTSDGKMWISSQSVGGLRYWDGKNWVVSLDGPTPIRCLLETADHQLLAGAVLDGLYVKP